MSTVNVIDLDTRPALVRRLKLLVSGFIRETISPFPADTTQSIILFTPLFEPQSLVLFDYNRSETPVINLKNVLDLPHDEIVPLINAAATMQDSDISDLRCDFRSIPGAAVSIGACGTDFDDMWMAFFTVQECKSITHETQHSLVQTRLPAERMNTDFLDDIWKHFPNAVFTQKFAMNEIKQRTREYDFPSFLDKLDSFTSLIENNFERRAKLSTDQNENLGYVSCIMSFEIVFTAGKTLFHFSDNTTHLRVFGDDMHGELNDALAAFSERLRAGYTTDELYQFFLNGSQCTEVVGLVSTCEGRYDMHLLSDSRCVDVFCDFIEVLNEHVTVMQPTVVLQLDSIETVLA